MLYFVIFRTNLFNADLSYLVAGRRISMRETHIIYKVLLPANAQYPFVESSFPSESSFVILPMPMYCFALFACLLSPIYCSSHVKLNRPGAF
jgi:hypothetical protein